MLVFLNLTLEERVLCRAAAWFCGRSQRGLQIAESNLWAEASSKSMACNYYKGSWIQVICFWTMHFPQDSRWKNHYINYLCSWCLVVFQWPSADHWSESFNCPRNLTSRIWEAFPTIREFKCRETTKDAGSCTKPLMPSTCWRNCQWRTLILCLRHFAHQNNLPRRRQVNPTNNY